MRKPSHGVPFIDQSNQDRRQGTIGIGTPRRQLSWKKGTPGREVVMRTEVVERYEQ
jgi:hypothetical protein